MSRKQQVCENRFILSDEEAKLIKESLQSAKQNGDFTTQKDKEMLDDLLITFE